MVEQAAADTTVVEEVVETAQGAIAALDPGTGLPTVEDLIGGCGSLCDLNEQVDAIVSQLAIGELCDYIQAQRTAAPEVCGRTVAELIGGGETDVAALVQQVCLISDTTQDVCGIDVARQIEWVKGLIGTDIACDSNAYCDPNEIVALVTGHVERVGELVCGLIPDAERSAAPTICGMDPVQVGGQMVQDAAALAQTLLDTACGVNVAQGCDPAAIEAAVRKAVDGACSDVCAGDPDAIVAMIMGQVQPLVARIQSEADKACATAPCWVVFLPLAVPGIVLSTVDNLSRAEVEFLERDVLDILPAPDGENLPTVVSSERVATSVATGKVVDALTLDTAPVVVATSFTVGGGSDSETASGNNSANCYRIEGNDDHLYEYDPIRIRYGNQRQAYGGGWDVFIFRRHYATQEPVNGRMSWMKHYTECMAIGLKRRNNYVLQHSGAYIGVYTEREKNINAQWDPKIGDSSQAVATIQAGATAPLAFNVSIPIYQDSDDKLDGSKWYQEPWTDERHYPYVKNLVNGWWEGRSDRFEGNVVGGVYQYKQSSSWPKTPEDQEADPYEVHEGFFAVGVVKYKCGSVFGVGC